MKGFTWDAARRELEGQPSGGLNIAHEAVDRHARGAGGDRVALRCVAKDGAIRDITYRALAEQTSRFANALRSLGIGRGDRVFGLLPRIPELYVACLGTLKNTSVFSPLFSAFGPEPIAARIEKGEGKVLVTTAALYAKKVAPVRERLKSLSFVLIIGDVAPAGCVALGPLLAKASDAFTIPHTDPDDMALLHFTSGTTGKPKGAVHVHRAVVAHHMTGKLALDFHPGDVFWCTADPG